MAGGEACETEERLRGEHARGCRRQHALPTGHGPTGLADMAEMAERPRGMPTRGDAAQPSSAQPVRPVPSAGDVVSAVQQAPLSSIHRF